MRKHSAWILELLFRLLLPARGRHRSAGAPLTARCTDTPTLALPRVTIQPPELLQGKGVPLMRPYGLTSEVRQERRAQRGRRRALWLAVHGIDTGPRWIHGVEVVG